MIIDSIENIKKYKSLHPLFGQAFEYILSNDLIKIEPDKYDIANGLKAIIFDNPGKTKEESLQKFECHNLNIDIQYCIRGFETIGWKPRKSCIHPKGEYNEEKDVLFYGDNPDTFFTLHAGQFAIFYPDDVHAPMIGDTLIKKLVIKVAI